MNNIDITEILFEHLVKRFRQYPKDGLRPSFFQIICYNNTLNHVILLRPLQAELALYPSNEPRLDRLIALSGEILSGWYPNISPLKTSKQPECIRINEGGVSMKSIGITYEQWDPEWEAKPYSIEELLNFTHRVNEYLKKKTGKELTAEDQQTVQTKTKISHQKQMALVDRLGIIDTLENLGLNKTQKAKIISLLVNKDEQNTREYLTYRLKEPDIAEKKKFFWVCSFNLL